jgi:hypothetical protein
MNELLKNLRVQAINYCMDKGSQGNLSEEVSEKFAELIVKECMDNLAWHGHDEAVSQLNWFLWNKIQS